MEIVCRCVFASTMRVFAGLEVTLRQKLNETSGILNTLIYIPYDLALSFTICPCFEFLWGNDV